MYIFGFLFLTSCKSVTVPLSITRMDIPESRHEGARFHAEVMSARNAAAEVIQNPNVRPPTTARPDEVSIEGDLGYGAGVSLLRKWEIAFRVNTLAPSMIKTKVQLIGDPIDEAKAGNFSLALSLGVGSSNFNYDQNNDISSEHDVEVERKQTAIDTALILGYRVQDKILMYGGFYTTRSKYDINLKQKISNDGLTGAADYNYNGNSNLTGINLGTAIKIAESEDASRQLNFLAELSGAKMETDNLGSKQVGGVSLGVHVAF